MKASRSLEKEGVLEIVKAPSPRVFVHPRLPRANDYQRASTRGALERIELLNQFRELVAKSYRKKNEPT